MQTNDGGGDRRQKDDIATPIHKTEEFKQTVKKITERNAAQAAIDSATTPKPVQFNIPIPGVSPSILPKRSGPHHSSMSFNQSLYNKELEKNVREQVNSEFQGAPVYVANKDSIDKEVQRRVDVIKQPRYVFLSNGTPFLLSKTDERAELEKSLIGETPFKKRWMLAKYDLANGVGSLVGAISEPSLKLKEVLTDQDQPNPIGAVAQLGLNSAILGWEYLNAMGGYNFRTQALIDNATREAEALKYTDPKRSVELSNYVDQLEQKKQINQSIEDRIKIAKQAVQSSWNQFIEDRDEIRAHPEEHPYIGSGAGLARKAYFEKLEQQEAAARDEAVSFRTQATQAYASGDFQKAIELTEQAQDADRRGTANDAYGAYTWVREPERLEKFKKDAALLELQKGAPLTTEEVRRLKEYHVNSWTELTGEFVFDPVNLIPATVLEDVIKLPFKGVSKASTAVSKEFPIYQKALNVMGSPVRWLMRESVQSGGNRIARQTYNLFERISNAYVKTEDVTKAIDDISSVVVMAREAPNEEAARAIFEQGRASVPGLQQVTFRDFKQLMDAGEHIDPTDWGKIYQDALVKSEDDLTAVAERTGKETNEIVSEFSKGRRALMEMSTKFHGAYVDPHRIFKGSRLVDDTLAGWVSKTMRELSGDEISDMLKASKFDEWAVKYGETLGDKSKALIKYTNRWVEASLGAAATVRDIWATVVLSTPRWFMNNLADTSMRSAVYGGDLWGDLVTLFTSTQRTLADELGYVPIEFSQALSRADLDFAETVTSRLLYENWKPKAGVFSYWKYEYQRLLQGDQALAKSQIIHGMLEGLPDGKLKHALGWLSDGLNFKVSLGAAVKAIPGGISDFNTAIEFTYRLRMFHREYFNLLERLEPAFMEKGMEALSPTTRDIAKQIWRSSEGNPRRITAYVENLLGGAAKNTPAQWSFAVPPELEKTLKGMDVTDRQLFMASVKNELDDFIETSTRAGKKLRDEDFIKFFDEYKTKMQDEIQERMSKSHDFRTMDGSINTDATANTVPDLDDLQGSAPIPHTENPRNKEIEKATSKLKQTKRRPTGDIAKDFETAISDYAKVEKVPGAGIRYVKKNGEGVLQIGETTLKKGSTSFYKEINEAVIQIFKNTDTDLILHSGFQNVEHYEDVLRKFIDDPTAILNDDERQFLALVNQMESHPQLKALIEQTMPQTSSKPFSIRYDSAMDVYRDLGVYSDSYGLREVPEKIFEDEAQKLRPLPGSHIAATNENRIITRKLADTIKTLPPEIQGVATDFLDQFTVHRQELKQLYTTVYPGPLLKSTRGEGRHAAWDLFYQMSEAQFRKEAVTKQKIIELLQTNPEAATKLMDDARKDFSTWFLKENGIQLEWDANQEILLNAKFIDPVTGRVRNYTSRDYLALIQRRFFTSDIKKKLLENPIIKIRSDIRLQLKHQIRNALRDTFDLPTAHAEAWSRVIDNHAQKWAQETGQDISKYYERLGFQRVEDGRGLATLENTRVVKRGAVQRTADGGFTFYGLGQSNFESMVRETGELFYDDLVSMAEHSPQSADDLKALKEFIESKTGSPIRGNRLEKVHSEVLSEMFTKYISEGRGPNIKIKGGLEKFKSWLSATFDGVRNTPVTEGMNDDTYRVLDRLFTESQLNTVPSSNKRFILSMAQEAGIPGDEKALLRIINESIVPSVNPGWSDLENSLAKGIDIDPQELAQHPTFQAAFDNNIEHYPGELAIPKQKGLTPEQRVVEARFVESIQSDLEGTITRYWDSLPENEKNVLNVDYARELSPDYSKDFDTRMKYAVATQKPSSMLIRNIWETKLREPLQGLSTVDKVVFTVGGGGSGKSSALRSVGGVSENLQNSHVVWDMTMSEMRDLGYVEQALAQGRNVQMVFVARDPIESLLGIASRAADEGRSVPLKVWAEAHSGAPKTFRVGLEKFANNPDLGIIVVDNTRGAGKATETSVDFLKTWDYDVNDLIKRGQEALDKGLENGKVRPDIYKTITGKEPPGAIANSEQLATRAAEGSQPGTIPGKQSTIGKGSGQQSQQLNQAVKPYTDLGEVPHDVAKSVLGRNGTALESKLSDELQQGWDVWKTQRGLKGFPEDALASPETFKAYLKDRIANEWSEASIHYNRLQWEVEQFEDSMLNYHAGDDFAETIFPRVHDAQISDGMRTFIRNNEKMLNNYESARTALDQWGKYLADMAKNGHPAQVLPKEEQAALRAWANQASGHKAELVDLLLHGGDHNGSTIEGAIEKVNRVMLDYQHTNVTDQMMKNFFPFWMFPSRSFPFWAETMATHPQLISNYEKIQRLSRSQRYQAGAVTSQGKPLPSLDGYIKIPGTDMWYNPLAPLSFRYLLDVAKSRDDILYAAQSEDDVEPKAFMIREMMETGQIYGFSLAPWATYLMKQAYGLPDEIVPRYPLIPEITLIPRWWAKDFIQKANKVNLFGMEISGLGDAMYPEVPWHDYMVERRILENALQQIQTGNLSEADKLKLMNQAQNAIKFKDQDDLWKSTYKEVTNEEWTRSMASFFSGMYPKNFSDSQADMLALRNDINLLKSSLNNEFQSSVFDMPANAHTAWDNYLNKLDTPEGWVHRLYTDIGWVKNSEGELVRDPSERAKWLAVKIEQDEDQQMYYDKMADLQNEFNKRIRALPVGADWSQAKVVYDWYSEERSSLDYLRTFEKVYGTNKPVELIQEDMAKDWYREVNAMRPRWEVTKGETYEQYQQRVMDWETNLPKIAPIFMRAYLRRTDLVNALGALHEDQRVDPSFFSGLVKTTNKDGLEQWEKKNDDVFDALNKGWKALYWDNYWHSVIGKYGYEVDLAENDFYAQHPEPPSSDELYQWIAMYYGPDKFTPDEIKKWVDGTDELSVEQRTLAGKSDPVDYKKRQEVWDLLSWIGPGNRNRDVFNTAFVNAGGDPDMLTVWYEESGEAYKTKPERLDQLHDAIQTAIKTLNLKPPKREELVRYIQAQHENDTFKQLIGDELGNGFFDWEDGNGQVQQGVYSYYNSLDNKSKKKFRREHREEYRAINDYYKMRKKFGKDHPTWSDYYGADTTPSVTLPEDAKGSIYTPPSLIHETVMKPKSKGGGGNKPAANPVGSYSSGSTDRMPYFNIIDRTGTYVSPGLYNLVGQKMAWEITSLFSSGRRISANGVNFLRSIASRYPEYTNEINSILAKGT